MILPGLNTYENIIAPIKKIRENLQFYIDSKGATVKTLDSKQNVLIKKMAAANSEINKSKKMVEKLTNFLGD